MPAVCTTGRVTEIEVRTVKHTRRCRCQVQVSDPRIGIVHGVGEGVTRSFRGKKFRKGPGNFFKIKSGQVPAPNPLDKIFCNAMPSGRSCPTGQKSFVHARLPARSALILEERAAAAVLLQQTYCCCCCCSDLQNRTRFSKEKDLGRNTQT